MQQRPTDFQVEEHRRPPSFLLSFAGFGLAWRRLGFPLFAGLCCSPLWLGFPSLLSFLGPSVFSSPLSQAYARLSGRPLLSGGGVWG